MNLLSSHKRQTGQGLVEYAILLLLTITLVIGGVELAATAMASNKATEAAKAGVNEYAMVNEKRLAIQTDLYRYLDKFERETSANSEIVEILDNIVSDHAGYFWNAYQSNAIQEVFSYDVTEYKVIINDGITSNPLEIDSYPKLQSIFLLIDGILDDNGDGIVDSSDRDNFITDRELYRAVKFHETLMIDATDPANEDGVNDQSFDIFRLIKELDPIADSSGDLLLEESYRAAKYQALILFEHIRLSLMPLDPRINLSESVPLLGDHDVALMSKPTCDASIPLNIQYFNGFNGEDLDVDGDGIDFDGIAHQQIDGVDYPAIYLFNPLPIDIESCSGVDAQRGNTNLISILVNGYGVEGTQEYVKGLPKLHQAYYSQYQSVCIDNASKEYVACGVAGSTNYLKPPGKLCISDTANSTVDSCPDLNLVNPDYIDASKDKYITGYYFWGKANESDPEVNGRFKWVTSQIPEFRPSFQLLCNGDSVKTQSIIGDGCLASSTIQTIKVNVRYRSVFESFLAFGMHELQDGSGLGLVNYFYDPANLRSLGISDISGSSVGSELGPKQENGLPTVKPFKDFRGCYTLDVSGNQISACN